MDFQIMEAYKSKLTHRDLLGNSKEKMKVFEKIRIYKIICNDNNEKLGPYTIL